MEYLTRPFFVFVRSRVFRAALSGGAGAIAQMAVFELLGVWLGVVRPSTAVIIGAEFGILTNFFIANWFVFGDAPPGALVKRLAQFHLVVVGSLVIQWTCVYWAETATSNVFILQASYIAGVLIGFIFNYTGYRLWVWRSHQPSDSAAR